MKNKYNFSARAAVLALTLTAVFALSATAIAQAPPGSLWYNGDFNGVGYHANGVNTSDPPSQVFDDFFVTGGGWHLTAVFSDNLLSTVVTGAEWEIRSGVSSGNDGTLVAAGSTNAPTVAATGRSGFGFTEFMVEVTGINVTLAPGTYWLNVTPVGNGTGHSLNSMTSGTNCVGMPCGNDGNSWWRPDGPYPQPYDFSMDVIGPIPEPATVALLTCGVGVLLMAVRRRRSA
jgi:hypothetical protein